jgi:hypothetical protein
VPSLPQRQIDDEFRPLGMVVPHPDIPVVIGDDGTDNG